MARIRPALYAAFCRTDADHSLYDLICDISAAIACYVKALLSFTVLFCFHDRKSQRYIETLKKKVIIIHETIRYECIVKGVSLWQE